MLSFSLTMPPPEGSDFCLERRCRNLHLDPTSKCRAGTKFLKKAQQAMSLHTSGVPGRAGGVGFTCLWLARQSHHSLSSVRKMKKEAPRLPR